ncbi:hypothetical protein [Botryobacter ruber]|nr:hypothetical protein [Botryobacter ruber]
MSDRNAWVATCKTVDAGKSARHQSSGKELLISGKDETGETYV